MPLTIWSGSISFGLANVPVKLYSAVHHQDLAFHQCQEGTNARVRNKRVSEKTGREVAYDDIVKGYEVEKGHYVMVDPDELADFAPRATRTIDIEDFVALDDIDPIFYEATYYLAPDKGEGARKAYVLVEEAPEEQAEVVDLMAALEASLEAAKKPGGTRKRSSSSKKRSSPRSGSGSKRKSA